jgi:hypothetical protein
MKTASLPFDSGNQAWTAAWTSAWRGLWQSLTPACSHRDCGRAHDVWRRLRRRPRSLVIQGLRYCEDGCGERALAEALGRIRSASPRNPAPHRIPLGLLLLSRHQLTAEQLRAALGAQRSAGRGRIGEWLLAFGLVNEQQVTAALARQWSCPVLRTNSLISGNVTTGTFAAGNFAAATFASGNPAPGGRRTPQIPRTLLESFVMIPVNYVESTATLHIAFGEGIDHSVLYAIEQIVGCRTESCMAVPSFVRQQLSALSSHRGESEMVFDRVADGAEFLRIIHSYCTRLAATEIRLAACGPHLWVRLLRPSFPALDLLLRLPWDASPHASFPVPFLAALPAV